MILHSMNTPVLKPILQSREFVSDDQKSQIRTALVAAFPAPSIDAPLNDYLYGDQFRKAPGEYEIPIFVTMPYSADMVATVNRIVIDKNGFTVPEQVQRHHEIANSLSSAAYVGTQIYAYRDAFRLPGGKYRLYAWAQAGTHWQSDASYVDFFVTDKEAMRQGLQESDLKVANKSDAAISRDVREQASKPVAAKSTPDKAKLRKLTRASKPIKGEPNSGVDFAVLNPTEGVRYKIAPRLIVLVPNRSDIVYRINECELAGSSNCSQYDYTISGSRLICDENDRNCRYDAPFDRKFVPNKAYMLIANLTPYQGYDAILINFEVGHVGEGIDRQMVPGEPGPIPKELAEKTRRAAPEVGATPPPPRERHAESSYAYSLYSGKGPAGMEAPGEPDSADEKRPIDADEPGIEKQLALSKPVITWPIANKRFTAPAAFRCSHQACRQPTRDLRHSQRRRDGRSGNKPAPPIRQFARRRLLRLCPVHAERTGERLRTVCRRAAAWPIPEAATENRRLSNSTVAPRQITKSWS